MIPLRPTFTNHGVGVGVGVLQLVQLTRKIHSSIPTSHRTRHALYRQPHPRHWRPEYAAAAYNAGEGPDCPLEIRAHLRRSFPNLSNSIPFTETREYVQSVLRNTDMYRALYGETPKSTVLRSHSKAHTLPLSPISLTRCFCSRPPSEAGRLA